MILFLLAPPNPSRIPLPPRRPVPLLSPLLPFSSPTLPRRTPNPSPPEALSSLSGFTALLIFSGRRHYFGELPFLLVCWKLRVTGFALVSLLLAVCLPMCCLDSTRWYPKVAMTARGAVLSEIWALRRRISNKSRSFIASGVYLLNYLMD